MLLKVFPILNLNRENVRMPRSSMLVKLDAGDIANQNILTFVINEMFSIRSKVTVTGRQSRAPISVVLANTSHASRQFVANRAWVRRCAVVFCAFG